MIDYHIHTSHSVDAEGSIKGYCEQAVKTGLKEICFTNHCELDRMRDDNLIRFNTDVEPITHNNLLKLQEEIFQAKEHYKKFGLAVKFGLEVGYYEGIESRLKEITEGLELDFLLGSIHCLDHICIDSSKEHEIYFSRHPVQELLVKYFQEVEKLVNSGLFDSIGHLDVYKKYGIKYYGEEIRTVQDDILRKLFKLMKEKNIALEINTAGLRRINEFYPSPSIMKMAYDAGIKLLTVGSDAHKVEDLGKDIDKAVAYAKSFGFDTLVRFEKRKSIPINV